MSDFFIDAGELRHKVSILGLVEATPGVFVWQEERQSYAMVEPGTGRNLFSSVGIGARDAKIILRRQELSPHQAIRWGRQHLFISSILPKGRQHLEVSAAMVSVVTCTGETFSTKPGAGNRPISVPGPVLSFPGVLTEKYVGYEREESHAVSSVTYVLITPKAISLTEGDLVTIKEGNAPGVYNIQKCHRLDDYKNEYEISRSRDV